METATREKRCKVCGTDMSQTKRTKDAAGNYYCEPCVQTARAGQKAGAENTSRRSCTNCGKMLGVLEQGVEWQGHQVCTTCAGGLEAEEVRRADADAAEAERVQQRQQAQAATDNGLQRMRKARRKALFSAITCGVLGVPMVVVPPVGLLFFAATIYYIVKYRRLNAVLNRGQVTDVHLDGIPAVVGISMAVGLSIVGLAFGILAGIACAVWADANVFGKDAPAAKDSLAWWFCLPLGIGFGGFLALSIWSKFESTFCPHCRRYAVAEVRGSEHVGTQVGTYQKTERLYTKAVNGTVLSTTDVPVERSEVTETYRAYCICHNCGHEWPRLRSLTRR